MPGVFRSSINLARWRGVVPNALNAGRVDAVLGAAAVAEGDIARQASLLATYNKTVEADGASQTSLVATYNLVAAVQAAMALQTTAAPTKTGVDAIYALLTAGGAGSRINMRAHAGDVGINNGNLVGYSTLPWNPVLTRSLLLHLGVTDTGGYPGGQAQIKWDTTTSPGSTLVKASRGYNVSDANVSYIAVEFL
jgi:hypothetical protein